MQKVFLFFFFIFSFSPSKLHIATERQVSSTVHRRLSRHHIDSKKNTKRLQTDLAASRKSPQGQTTCPVLHHASAPLVLRLGGGGYSEGKDEVGGERRVRERIGWGGESEGKDDVGGGEKIE